MEGIPQVSSSYCVYNRLRATCALALLLLAVAVPARAGLNITEIDQSDRPFGCVALNNASQLVYCAYTLADGTQVYLHDLSTGTTTRLSNQREILEPHADLNDMGQVVWAAGDMGAHHVYLYDGAAVTAISVDGDNLEPRLNNTGQVVWRRAPPGGGLSAIVLYNVADGALTQISAPETVGDMEPDINDAGQMIWKRQSRSWRSLVRLDPGGGLPVQLYVGKALAPHINNKGSVAWTDPVGSGAGVYLDDGLTQQFVPLVGGQHLGLNEADSLVVARLVNGISGLFWGNGAGLFPLTSTSVSNSVPAIDDSGRIAWVQGPSGGPYRLLVAFDDPTLVPQPEICNGRDDDLDGQADEFVTVTVYADADSDGWGTGPPLQGCSVDAGFAPVSGDCDDTNPDVHPQALEVCNGADDNCNLVVDEGVTSRFFRDLDADGYGDSAYMIDGCPAPGLVDNSDDCDDTRADVHPGATEVCNLLDDNCDGTADEWVCNTVPQSPGDPVVAGAGLGIDVVFASVQVRGETLAVERLSAPDVPAGYASGAFPVYYDISTTAAFVGDAVVCIPPEAGRFAPDADLRVLHWDANAEAWGDLPQVANPDTPQVCGLTPSFSTFTLAEALPPPPSPPVDSGSGGGCAAVRGTVPAGGGMLPAMALAALLAALRGAWRRHRNGV